MKFTFRDGIIAALVGVLCSCFQHAHAADLTPKAPANAFAVSNSSPCTPVSCTGPYGGVQIGGNGTNLDIIGSGLNNSVFAGGAVAGVKAGYQYTDTKWILGAEASVNYQFQSNATVNGVSGNTSGMFSYEVVKIGGNVSGLLGNSAPITVPPSLANSQIGLYGLAGPCQRQFKTSGWCSGGGGEFDISTHIFVNIDYIHAQYGAGTLNGLAAVSSEDRVMTGLNYKF